MLEKLLVVAHALAIGIGITRTALHLRRIAYTAHGASLSETCPASAAGSIQARYARSNTAGFAAILPRPSDTCPVT